MENTMSASWTDSTKKRSHLTIRKCTTNTTMQRCWRDQSLCGNLLNWATKSSLILHSPWIWPTLTESCFQSWENDSVERDLVQRRNRRSNKSLFRRPRQILLFGKSQTIEVTTNCMGLKGQTIRSEIKHFFIEQTVSSWKYRIYQSTSVLYI